MHDHEQERDFLEANTLASQTEANAPKGVGYGIGSFVGNTPNFLLQFGAAPGAGTVKGVVANIGKELGTKTAFATIKGTMRNPRMMGRLAGAIGTEAASISSTTQLGENMKQTFDRAMQSPVVDGQGNIVGFEGEPLWQSFAKTGIRSVGTNSVFLTPAGLGEKMLGSMQASGNKLIAGAGAILAKGGRIIPTGDPVETLAKIKTTELIPMALGDGGSLLDWANPVSDENLTLIGGILAADFATGSVAKVPQGRAFYKMSKAKVDAMKAYAHAVDVFSQREGGLDALKRFGNAVADGDVDAQTQMLGDFMRRSSMSTERSDGKEVIPYDPNAPKDIDHRDEYRALIDWYRAVNRYMGTRNSYYARYPKSEKPEKKSKVPVEDVMFDEETGEGFIVNDHEDAANNRYNEGYAADTPEAQKDISQRAAQARQRVVDLAGEDVAAAIESDPMSAFDKLGDDPQFNQAVTDFVNALAGVEGMRQKGEDAATEKADAATKEVDARANDDDGMVHGLTMKLNDRRVYLKKGRIVMTDDGTMVDTRASDHDLWIYDPATGKTEMTTPDAIFTVDEPVAADQLKEEAAQQVQDEAQQADKYQKGFITIRDAEGNERRGTVTGERGEDGRIKVFVESGDEEGTGEFMEFTPEELDAIAVSYEREERSGDNQEKKGLFGHIYSQFKGKAKEAARWLFGKKEGEALGVFHREDTGDISLIWGDDKKGLSHIIAKHIERQDDFGSVDEMLDKLSDVVENGELTAQENGNIRIDKDGYRAVLARTENGKFVITVFDSSRPQSEKRRNDADLTRLHQQVAEEMNGELVSSRIDEKEKGVPGVSTDIGPQPAEGGNKVTTPLPDTLSDDKGKKNPFYSDKLAEEKPQESALSRIPHDKDGNPDFQAVDPKTAEAGLTEFMGNEADAAEYAAGMEQDALAEVKKTSAAINKVPFSRNAAAWKEAKAIAKHADDEARRKLEHWRKVQKIYKDRAEAEVKAREARAAAKATEEFTRNQQAKAQQKAEEEQRGAGAIGANIVQKWQQAEKTLGAADTIILPNGQRLRGRYVLVEADSPTTTHNPLHYYDVTPGTPLTKSHDSINDRNYAGDLDAQEQNQYKGRNFDGRALQDVPVINPTSGFTMSGNDRNMARLLASVWGTDGAYIEDLKQSCGKFGFTPQDCQEYKHPTVQFMLDEDLPYTTEAMAMFNAPSEKRQNLVHTAIKLGKMVGDEAFADITREIGRYDSMADFYGNEKSVAKALGIMEASGAFAREEATQMRTKLADGRWKLEDAGKNLFEALLIGKSLEKSPDAVRQITAFPTMRQAVVMALPELADNRLLSEDYRLDEALTEAIDLCYRAKAIAPQTFKEGVPVSPFGSQENLFADEFGSTVVKDLVSLIWADTLNDTRPCMLRNRLATYNSEARLAEAGQGNIFSGRPDTKEEILNTVLAKLKNVNPKDERALLEAARAERRQRAEAENAAEAAKQSEPAVAERQGTGEEPPEASELVDTRGSGRGEQFVGGGPSNTQHPAPRQGGLAQRSDLKYKLSDEVDENGRQFVLNSKGELEFGHINAETTLPAAPILLSEGMITNSETNAGYGLVHIEARHGDQIRKAGYASVLDFIEEVAQNYEVIKRGKLRDGVATYILQLRDKHNNTLMVELSGDGTYWNINTAGIFKTTYGADREEIYNRHTTEKLPAEAIETSQKPEPSGTTDPSRMNVPKSPEDKVTKSPQEKQAKETESSDSEEQKDFTADELSEAKEIADNFTGQNLRGEIQRKMHIGYDKAGKIVEALKNIPKDKPGTDDEPDAPVPVEPTPDKPVQGGGGYTIEPTPYTNKKGKTTDCFLVKFDRELTKAERDALNEYCKEPLSAGRKTGKGWFDRAKGGYMMRSEDAAKGLTDIIGDESGEAVADNAPLTPADLKAESQEPRAERPAPVTINQVNVEDLLADVNNMVQHPGVHRGEVKLSDHSKPVEPEQPATPTLKDVAKSDWGKEHLVIGGAGIGKEPAKPEPERQVSDEEMSSLADQLRDLLGEDNDGADNSILFRDGNGELTKAEKMKVFTIGTQIAMGMIERGTVDFPDFAAKLIKGIGESVRPFIKSFYSGAMRMPGMEGYRYTPQAEVDAFDIANFDAQRGVIAAAQQIVDEQQAQDIVEEGARELKKQRNERRKAPQQQPNEGESSKRPSLTDVVRTIIEKGKEAASKLFSRTFFDVAETPGFMKKYGLTGEKFTVRYGVIARHFGKDASHSLGWDVWEKLPVAIQEPLAITRFGNREGSFRLYTSLKNGKGETVVVGVDVKNAGKDIEVNSVTTVFGRREDAGMTEKETLVYPAENEITPEVSSLLGRPNSGQYPTARRVTEGKDNEYPRAPQARETKYSDQEKQKFLVAEIERHIQEYAESVGAVGKEAAGREPTYMQLWQGGHRDDVLRFYTALADTTVPVKDRAGAMATAIGGIVKEAGSQQEALDLADGLLSDAPVNVAPGVVMPLYDAVTEIWRGRNEGSGPDWTATIDTPASKSTQGDKKPDTKDINWDALRDNPPFVVTEQAEKEFAAREHGFKIGDAVVWDAGKQGKYPAKLIDVELERGMAVLDTGSSPMLSVLANWKDISHVDAAATPTASKPKKGKKAVKSTDTMGDLFSQNLDDENGENGENSVNLHKTNKNEKNVTDRLDADQEGGESDRAGQGMAGQSGRPDDVGADATGTDGGLRPGQTAAGNSGRDADGHGEERPGGTQREGTPDDDFGGLQQPHRPARPDEGGPDRGSGELAGNGRPGRDDRPGTSRGSQADGGGEGLSSGRPATVAGQPSGAAAVSKPKPKPQPKYIRNFRYGEDGNEADNYTPSQRLNANVSALEVLTKLLEEGRHATDEERVIMSRFRGWGQVDLKNAYDSAYLKRNNPQGSALHRLGRVIDTLDPNGEKGIFEGIKRAAQTAYYTPTPIARAMNTFLPLAGFRGGKLLDPSMGSGIFEGTLPKDLQERTMITGVELDWLTGQLARALYPDAEVRISGFEKAGIMPGSMDVVTSNVPFGDFSVNDPTWKNNDAPIKRSSQKKIHNYFAVKMLECAKPGGLVAMMTTRSVMDTASNQNVRQHIVEQGEFLGAIRMPDNTFQGTGAVADIIFIRKWRDDNDAETTRSNPEYALQEQLFLTLKEDKAPNKLTGVPSDVKYNSYYFAHPKNMIGDMQAGGQYSDEGFGLHSTLSVDEIAGEIEKAVKKIVGSRKGQLFNQAQTTREVRQAVTEEYHGTGDWVSNGNIIIQNGKVGTLTTTTNEYKEVTRIFEENPTLKKHLSRFTAMGKLRTAMKQLIAAQLKGEATDETLAQLRKTLKANYDAFVARFGKLQSKENEVLCQDIDGYTIRALEKWKDGKFLGLSDMFTTNTIKPALKLDVPKTPQEAISVSLAEYGELRPDYLAKSLGEDWAEKCGDMVFEVPNTDGRYETRDEYLSGEVVKKLAAAREAAKEDPKYERNVNELLEVQPVKIPYDDIVVHFGARWIPQDIINDFVREVLGLHPRGRARYRYGENPELRSGVVYLPETDSFEVHIDKDELGGEAEEWKTGDRTAAQILGYALEDKSSNPIMRRDSDGSTWVDQHATELVNSKIEAMRERFQQWLPLDDTRVKVIEDAYNERFNSTVLRKWDGSHLNIPGLMGMELRPHQKDAVWMLINSRGGIVDHIVGAGKTLVMQSAIMEMRRMGIAKKPMIVALKSTVPQITREFKEAYPTARVLAPSEKDFQKKNRKKFIANIALNDYDCVILNHEQYCMLPHTEEAERAVIDEQLQQLDAMIEYLYGTEDKSQLTKKQIKALEKRRLNLLAKMEKRLDRSVDREFCFEDLGVDYLFVDESHQFKSVPYVTSYQKIAGLGSPEGSDKAVALLTGIRYLQKMHQGDRGTIFLSGTTITNSLVEIYNLLNYLRPRKMRELGMTTFDAWASTFAVHSSELEADTTGEFRSKDRFRNFDNVPELSQLYAEIADVRNDSNLQLPKPKVAGNTVIVPQSPEMAEINREVVKMLQNKNGSYFGIHPKDDKKEPWSLDACTISGKASVSPRLVFPDWDDTSGKIYHVCEKVKKSYDEFAEQKGVQLIFCEIGVPGKDEKTCKPKEYDAYNDIIKRLTKEYGIPRKEIAYIQEAGNDEKRKALFQRVCNGEVRILIGGVKNMGTGVNVQPRITDMHMLSVPWQPAALEQCIGRGARQGNMVARDFMGNKVRVWYYATEGSLDLYKYQLLDAKGKMFTAFKTGTIGGERSFDEGSADEDGNIDPAEMVAILSGNPVIFEKSKQDKLVKKLRSLQNGFLRDLQRRQAKLEDIQKSIENFERLVRLSNGDVTDLKRGGFTMDENGVYPTRVRVSDDGSRYGGITFDKPKEAGAVQRYTRYNPSECPRLRKNFISKPYNTSFL